MFKRSGGSSKEKGASTAVERAGSAASRDFTSAEGGDLEAEIADWINTERPLLGAILIEMGLITR